MGHEPEDMGGRFYMETVDDERLLAVVNHVRTWLFGEAMVRHRDCHTFPVLGLEEGLRTRRPYVGSLSPAALG